MSIFTISDLMGRANYLVLPVSLLRSMPEEWQEKFVEQLEEFAESFEDGSCSSYRVTKVDEDGNEIKDRYGYRHDRFEVQKK